MDKILKKVDKLLSNADRKEYSNINHHHNYMIGIVSYIYDNEDDDYHVHDDNYDDDNDDDCIFLFFWLTVFNW